MIVTLGNNRTISDWFDTENAIPILQEIERINGMLKIFLICPLQEIPHVRLPILYIII